MRLQKNALACFYSNLENSEDFKVKFIFEASVNAENVTSDFVQETWSSPAAIMSHL